MNPSKIKEVIYKITHRVANEHYFKKSAQLLLANILCHMATSRDELEKITDNQGIEIKELIFNCVFSEFTDKFDLNKH